MAIRLNAAGMTGKFTRCRKEVRVQVGYRYSRNKKKKKF